MTTTHKASTPADLLRLVPPLLGFTPENSFVLVPLKGGRSIGAMRFDLPAAGEDVVNAARVSASLAARAGADSVVVVTYGDRNDTLVEWVTSSVTACGMVTAAALYVTDHVWGDYQDPAAGGPASEVAPTLPVPDQTQVSGATLPEVPAEYEGVTPTDDLLLLSVGMSLFEHTLTTEVLERDTLAAMMTILRRPATRDIFLVQVATDETGGERALAAQEGWEGGEDYPVELGKVMWGEGAQPAPERLTRALEVCRLVAAADPTNTGALATCGWLSWALGRSTHAGWYAERALQIDPEHGLSQIVDKFVTAGHLPDWAFTR